LSLRWESREHFRPNQDNGKFPLSSTFNPLGELKDFSHMEMENEGRLGFPFGRRGEETHPFLEGKEILHPPP